LEASVSLSGVKAGFLEIEPTEKTGEKSGRKAATPPKGSCSLCFQDYCRRGAADPVGTRDEERRLPGFGRPRQAQPSGFGSPAAANRSIPEVENDQGETGVEHVLRAEQGLFETTRSDPEQLFENHSHTLCPTGIEAIAQVDQNSAFARTGDGGQGGQ
jgi:hypothetical protein